MQKKVQMAKNGRRLKRMAMWVVKKSVWLNSVES